MKRSESFLELFLADRFHRVQFQMAEVVGIGVSRHKRGHKRGRLVWIAYILLGPDLVEKQTVGARWSLIKLAPLVGRSPGWFPFDSRRSPRGEDLRKGLEGRVPRLRYPPRVSYTCAYVRVSPLRRSRSQCRARPCDAE